MVQAIRRLKQLRALCCFCHNSNGTFVSGTTATTGVRRDITSVATAASLLTCNPALIGIEKGHFIKEAAFHLYGIVFHLQHRCLEPKLDIT